MVVAVVVIIFKDNVNSISMKIFLEKKSASEMERHAEKIKRKMCQVIFNYTIIKNKTTVYNDRLTAFDPGQPG